MERILSTILENFWKITCTILVAYILRAKFSLSRRFVSIAEDGDYVLNIIINIDHKMSKGKVISQICHAISSVVVSLFENKDLLRAWKRNGEGKIVLKAHSDEIHEVVKKAEKEGVACHKIHDAGRTQVPPGANTVVVLGPALRSILKNISGDLKLY